MLSLMCGVFEIISLRHRIIDSAWESSLLSQVFLIGLLITLFLTTCISFLYIVVAYLANQFLNLKLI